MIAPSTVSVGNFNGNRYVAAEMPPEPLLHELLGLGKPWRVVRCEYEAQDDEETQTAGGVVRLGLEETPAIGAEESARAKPAACYYDHVEE
jgi:hypothetical protein